MIEIFALIFVGALVSAKECDVVIAGGSTAAFAAAITASEAAPELKVCLTEPTDWVGGQLTVGGVPAIDFGGFNSNPDNQPSSFRDFVDHLQGNPGVCTVSSKCFLPHSQVEEWFIPRLKRSPNLEVLYLTVVANTTRHPDGSVKSISVIRRKPKTAAARDWEIPLSQDFEDWYNPVESQHYQKETIELTGKVFVEATEVGDILATGGFPYAIGFEQPHELSPADQTSDQCGQSATLTIFMEMLKEKNPHPIPVPPGGLECPPNLCDYPNETWVENGWLGKWVWRRARCASTNETLCPTNGSHPGEYSANAGDITQQNWGDIYTGHGNDVNYAYPFLGRDTTAKQVKTGWKGGVNTTTLAMLEGRSYGWYHFMVNSSRVFNEEWPHRIEPARHAVGTLHGLSKWVYIRDTRRSAAGLDGFRLAYDGVMNYCNQSDAVVGFRFHDRVALANYNDDTHWMALCNYPPYFGNHLGNDPKPFYIPFRALTVQGSSNLLVSGKTMSQTFHGNACTRLHPSEWTAGVAAGGAAVLMVRKRWSTRQVYEHYDELAAFLNSSTVGQPLDWAGASETFECDPNWNRCYSAGFKCEYHNNTCAGTCSPLRENEWVALSWEWDLIGDTIVATRDTVLKKSVIDSHMLPDREKLEVKVWDKCELVSPVVVQGYYLCVPVAR